METVSPEQAGMNGERLSNAFRILEDAVKNKKIPGAAAVIGRHGKIAATFTTGLTMVDGPEVRLDTIYDCASLTKVAATLPLFLKLLEQGRIDLNEPVSSYFPEFQEGQKALITIEHLLTHTAGLKPFVNGTFEGWTPQDVKRFILSRALDYEPGTRVVYSDLGFIILGEIVSKLFDQPLDQAAGQHLYQPLGMGDSQFNPPAHLRKRIAATEFREDFGRYVWGEVHDERAYAMGGVSGHAGLFSTAADLARYAAMWLNRGELDRTAFFSPMTVTAALKDRTASLHSHRGLGWVLKGDSFDASGDLFSPSSYGHTGFTGTSLWIDPESGLFVVLLTNRVHFGREVSIKGLRIRFHNAVAGSIMK